jgi:hypothetical protein
MNGGDKMDKKTGMAEIGKKPLEEKLVLLGETDKAYIWGYIDRALLERKNILRKRTKKAPC